MASFSATSWRGHVALDVRFDYYPDDSNNTTGISNVSLALHVVAAAAPKVAAKAPAVARAQALDDDHPPANEDHDQRIARQLRETSRVLAQDVADADREGFAGIELVIESDGKEIRPTQMRKLEPRNAAQGAHLTTAEALRHIAPLLEFLAGSPSETWRYALAFQRNAAGHMEFARLQRQEFMQSTATPMTEKALMAQYGIPDRQQIYADIFKKTEKEVKASAVMVGTFAIEQIAFWIAGGWLFKGLGLVGEAAFPRLAALLRVGGQAEITSALDALDSAEGKELGELMSKLKNGESLSARETSRLGELYAKVETSLAGRAAEAAGRWMRSTESMSARAAEYQGYITGRPGEIFELNGIRFDGIKNGVLLDAKSYYAQFVEDGVFKPWWTGAQEFITEARNQLAAADGAPIEWHFLQKVAADATRVLFRENNIVGIDIFDTPM